MKTWYRVIASMMLLTVSLTSGNTQGLISSASGNSLNDFYQDNSGADDFAPIDSKRNENNFELLAEQQQGYSHGIEYKSSSNSFNMMECVKFLEIAQTSSTGVDLINPKYASMSKVLSLSNQEAEAFFPSYARYESELNALTASISDSDRLLEHQQILKERFFDEMNRKTGSYLASRFLAWENCYSNTCRVR